MNDIDMWNDLESMDKRTKEYKQEFENYCNLYINNKKEVLK